MTDQTSEKIAAKCKELVTHYVGGWPQNSVQCSRTASLDGYCKQHHPDTVRARRKATQQKFDGDMARRRQPFERVAELEHALSSATAQLAERDATIERLRGVALEYVLAFEHGSHSKWCDALERLRALSAPSDGQKGAI